MELRSTYSKDHPVWSSRACFSWRQEGQEVYMKRNVVVPLVYENDTGSLIFLDCCRIPVEGARYTAYELNIQEENISIVDAIFICTNRLTSFHHHDNSSAPFE